MSTSINKEIEELTKMTLEFKTDLESNLNFPPEHKNSAMRLKELLIGFCND